MSRIAVIGAGAWGTALAISLGRKHEHAVRLWANEPDVVESVAGKRVNDRFLPECKVPISVEATNDLRAALDGAEIVVSVVPSQYCRTLFERIGPLLRPETLIVSCTKGLENGTLLRMSELIADVLRAQNFTPRVGALSGPSFAKEVARGDPTAVTIASDDSELARAVQHVFNSSRFRVYTNDDVIGVELGGALKNIIAIAAGICDGLELGHNSVAALITRGLAEIARLVVACGGRLDTMAGLAGLEISCSPARATSRATAASVSNSAKGASSPTLLSACTARSPRVFSLPKPPSGWLAKRTSKCRLRSRCSPSSNRAKRRSRRLKN